MKRKFAARRGGAEEFMSRPKSASFRHFPASPPPCIFLFDALPGFAR
jgi:hypothetical protein